jgi:hypothetical protein
MASRSTAPETALSAQRHEEKPADASSSISHTPSPSVDERGPLRQSDVDLETGRIRPISAEEWQARQADLTKRLAVIDAEDGTSDDLFDEFMRNLDEERRRQGRPAAFEGCY